jgi:putative endonuclease
MTKICAVYILANKSNSVLYTGVTSNLMNRMFEHKSYSNLSSFVSRYKVNKLVYYEEFDDVSEAILREKQIKAGSRKKKIKLVDSINSDWKDLCFDFWGSDQPG